MEFLITTIVAVILLVGVESSCPDGCRCHAISEGVAVYCNSRGLDSIPKKFPSDTYALHLENNHISKIEENAFNNLPNLTYLWLNNNDISKIAEKAFNNLPKLYGLHLGSNDISKIEKNAFNNLPSLTYLVLNNNHISKIEENAFNNLPNLTFLYLINNTISFVSGKAFANLKQLQELNFTMDCSGCDNIPFWKWLKQVQNITISVSCNDFDGNQLSSLQQNDFTGCSANDGNGSVWCSRQGDWKWLVCMFFMISLRYIMSNI